MRALLCGHCGFKEIPSVIQKGPHYKAICSNCGKYIKFLKKSQVDQSVKIEIDEFKEPNEIQLNEIIFKLDLIIDRLEINPN